MSGDIKLGSNIDRNVTTKIDKLIDILDDPRVNEERKRVMTSQTENLGFIDGFLVRLYLSLLPNALLSVN